MTTPVEKVLQRISKLRTNRSIWEQTWEDLRSYVRPQTTSFRSYNQMNGEQANINVYDGTALWALNQFAGSLSGYLVPSTQRWFNLKIAGVQTRTLGRASKLWLEDVSDLIYAIYQKPGVRFIPALHECFLDIGAFGTCVLYQEWNVDVNHITFRSFPLSDCFIAENSSNMVDTVYRLIVMTTRQVLQEFENDGDIPKQIIDEKDQDKKWRIWHCVQPRTDRNVFSMNAKNKAYASYYICEDTKSLITESGYDGFPYHVPRWFKLSGEEYGRSPAMDCLPDIRMVNQMSKTTIKAAEKVVDPPLQVPDDGFILPIRTTPAALIFHEPGIDKIEPLLTQGRIELGLEMENQRREHILRAFYVDWLMSQKNNVEMTAAEVYDRREEKLRQMAPMLGRLQDELLGPNIARTYSLLARAGKIPRPPGNIGGAAMEIEYVSPAARAQNASKIFGIQQFTQDITPFVQSAPDIMDAVDMDELAAELASIREVSPRVLRTPDQIAAIRKRRAEAMQAQQQAELQVNQARAAKDLSQARKVATG